MPIMAIIIKYHLDEMSMM